jgi:hypothetical protein
MGLLRRPTPGEIVEGGRFSRPYGPGALRAHQKNHLAASPPFPHFTDMEVSAGHDTEALDCSTSSWARSRRLASFLQSAPTLYPKLLQQAARSGARSREDFLRFLAAYRKPTFRSLHPLCLGFAVPSGPSLRWFDT